MEPLTIKFGVINGESLILAGLVLLLVGVLGVKLLMRRATVHQIEAFERFKLEIAQNLGETVANLQGIRVQSESTNRALEKRIEAIEHEQVHRDDFVREVTLLHAANADLQRYILSVSNQLENLKTLLLKDHAT